MPAARERQGRRGELVVSPPVRRSTWERLLAADARPLAAFRIAVGAVALTDAIDRARDAFTFYSDRGLLAAGASLPRLPGQWSLLDLGASPAAVVVFFAAFLLVAAAFTLGYRTRLTTILLWLAVCSIQNRNAAIGASGDTALRALCFWAMFADLGGRFSLDVALGRRAPADVVPGLPARALELQVCLVYVFALLTKTGQTWREGSAVFFAVQGTDFGRPLGLTLAAAPGLCRALTYGTLLVEAVLPPLVLFGSRRARAAALAAGVALHAGIFATMRVGVFSLVMPASYALFVSGARWEALARRLGGGSTALATPPPRPRPLAWALLAQMILVVLSLSAPAGRARWRRWVNVELAALGLRQSWTLFAPDPPQRQVVYGADGVRGDGSVATDVLARAAPMLLPHPGFWYSRWFKYRSGLSQSPEQSLITLGGYLCRRYNGGADAPQRLARFVLRVSWREIRPWGQPEAAWENADLLHQSCAPITAGP
jgi:hypothetical protein